MNLYKRESFLSDQNIKIFIFHHAGGNAQNYQLWKNFFPNHWDAQVIEYPGRLKTDELCQNMQSLVNHLINELHDDLQEPYVIFGHSMGSLVAFEFAYQTIVRNIPKPLWIGVSSRYAPHLNARVTYQMHQLSDAVLINNLKELGGISASLGLDAEVKNHFLKLIRADFKVCESYQLADQQKIDIPISCFFGNQDPWVVKKDLYAWKELTTAQFSFHEYDGGHFYLNFCKKEVITQIIADVEAVC